jgi:hypothetical protein
MFGPPCVDYGTEIFIAEDDTIIAGKDFQKIKSTMFGDYRYLRKDSIGKVFYRSSYSWDTSEHLLYDFSLIAGDTASIYNSFSTVSFMVDSVDTVMIGKLRKRMFVYYQSYFSGYDYLDIWIEGIGATLTSFHQPGIDYTLIDGPETLLLCFFENDSMLYHDTNFFTCVLDSIWTGIENEKINEGLKIYPHPITEQSVIEFEKVYQHIDLKIYDLTGRVMSDSKFLQTNKIVIDRKNIISGVLFYSIETDGEMWRGKLIIN